VIGIAIGDGNLSNPNGRAVRIRISCNTKYPQLIKNFILSIKKLLPENKVSLIKRPPHCADISCYSNQWEKILPWKASGGPKHKQNVSIPKWILNNKRYSRECLRGLIQTDGSIYSDRGYLMINFTTIIPKLAKDVQKIIHNLGFNSKINIIKEIHNKYVVRISKNTKKFIEEINLVKN